MKTYTTPLEEIGKKPTWLADIHPIRPAEFIAYPGEPVYPPSRLTAHIITPASLAMLSAGRLEWHGWAFVAGEIVDSASRSREAQAARAARKAARREEHYAAAARRLADRMDAGAGRRAARSARRIMMLNRRRYIAAFGKEEGRGGRGED